MDGTRSISIPPDGLNLYGAGWDDNAVTLLSRDTAPGVASFLGRLKPGEDDIFALDVPHFLTVSPDEEKVYQGLPNPLANPMLTLYSGSEVIAENDDWGKDSGSEKLQVFADVGPFSLASGSPRYGHAR